MMNEALSRIQENAATLPNEGKNIHLLCKDAIPLPYQDSQFDLLYMSFVLDLFDTPDISTLLVDCKRVLKPEGRILIVSLAKRKREGLSFDWSFSDNFLTFLYSLNLPDT